MSLLLETIKVENGILKNTKYHNERINKARRQLFAKEEPVDVNNIIHLPDNLDEGIYKCRLIYGEATTIVHFIPYERRKIERLKTVFDDTIEYSHKFLDRTGLEALVKKMGCASDEEILIIKNGFVTDTSYTNVVFYDGSGWFTPAYPLLEGTMRARLLDEGKIREAEIRVSDLPLFKEVRLINSMLGFEEAPSLPIEKIIF